MNVTGNRRRLCGISVVVLVVAAALSLAGCGSSSNHASSSSSGSAKASASSSASGGADPTKVYAPGVPTLQQLRTKGSESEPPSSGPPGKKGISVIFVSCSQESPGCRTLASDGASAAAALGWKYQVIDGQNSDQGWANGVRTAIAAKPNLIITSGMSCPDVVEPLKEAKAAGIPVLGIWGATCNSPLYGNPSAPPGFTIPMIYNAAFPTTQDYYYAWGKIEAEYMIDATQGKGQIILSPYAVSYGNSMLQAYQAELKKCTGCKIVDTVKWVNTDQADGFTAKFQTALVQHPEANAAIFPFDSTAVNAGGAKAIVDAGRQKTMIASCGEGGAEAQDLIRNDEGLTACSAGMDLKWLAWAGFDEANRYLQGKPSVPEGVGFHVVDKTNLSAVGQGVHSSKNFVKAYEDIWKG